MKRILVVEDEDEIRKTITEMLESSGYEVRQAADGQQALDYLESEIPDLIISDIMMPKVNGYQVLESVRNKSVTESTPFIFLSAKTDYHDLRMGMNCGAEDFLFKPFRVKELIKAIETQFHKKEVVTRKFERICLNISSSVPHELLTPIIPIIGYPDLLMEDFESFTKEEIIHMLNLIKLSGKQLNKTVGKFLKFLDVKLRLMDSNKSEKKKGNDNSMIQDIVKTSCINNFVEHNRREDLIIEIDDAEVSLSPFDLELVTDEIVSNALKFSDSGSQIQVIGKILNDKYHLAVSDNGRGMSKEQLYEIIPFLQHERTRFEQKGLGLGLITIKKIMEYYGGELMLESILNKKTTCTILLPLTIQSTKMIDDSFIGSGEAFTSF